MLFIFFYHFDFHMGLSVAAFYMFISNLKVFGWLKRFKSVNFLISVYWTSQRKQTWFSPQLLCLWHLVLVIVTAKKRWLLCWLINVKTLVLESVGRLVETNGRLPISDLVGLGWDLIIFIFNELPGNAEAAGPETTLRTTGLGQYGYCTRIK